MFAAPVFGAAHAAPLHAMPHDRPHVPLDASGPVRLLGHVALPPLHLAVAEEPAPSRQDVLSQLVDLRRPPWQATAA